MTTLIILHTLAATIWIGGHLILSISIVPEAWKKKDHTVIGQFEERFERLGIPALIIQVITGIWMAILYLPPAEWFSFNSSLSALIASKLVLLILTVGLAIHARFFIIPKLNNDKIALLAIHIYLVTFISILFLIVGLSFRLGFLFP